MDPAVLILIGTAVTIAFIHTLIGVDHYLPFVVIGKARGWSLRKTLTVTSLCGIGHVIGSILLGVIGIGLGVALEKLEFIEGVRGSVAAWALITFGLVYASWSFIRTRRNHSHSHVHQHADGTIHKHEHNHHLEHAHAHEETGQNRTTFWTLFIIFAFGPCEALIPLLMVPAWEHDWWTVAAVVTAFSTVTVVTMVSLVAIATRGMELIPRTGDVLQRYANTFAGLAIFLSGMAIQVLGI